MKTITKVLIVCLAVAAAITGYIYNSDRQSVAQARYVSNVVARFCLDRHRLPTKEEFASLFPELPLDTDWFYWLAKDLKQVAIQYPMSSKWHADAPGTPKRSEFTATTYAYVMTMRCP